VAEELTKLGGAAVIMQTAPSPKAFQGLVGGLQAGGTVLSLSPVGSVEIDTLALLNKGATLMGWPSGHALDSEEAIRFASTHGIKCMINTYPLKDVQQAVDDLAAGKPRFRNVLVMQ
jgi:D-arabinose 1-dehydrogenase-like Zn-dependent alcohol dehydrogenase